jgi:hypothetical protein
MNYTAEDHFPTWYKSAKVASTNELIKARLEAINELVTNEDISFWQDVIRISVGFDPADTKTTSKFVKPFLEADTSFPVTNNENLLKVLAGCALCFKLEAEDLEAVEESETKEGNEEEAEEPDQEDKEIDENTTTNVNTAISLCIANLNFLGQFKNDNIPTAEYAQNYLDKMPYYERLRNNLAGENELEQVSTKLNGPTALTNDDHRIILQSVQQLQRENVMQGEELNVLSWIFGEYSHLAGKFFQDAGPSLMAVCGALELQEKTATLHYLNSAKGFLHRILTISNSSKKLAAVSLYDSINDLPAELKTSLAKQYKNQLSELTPYLFAISKSTEFEAGQDYTAPFKKLTKGGDLKKTYKPDVIATQVYNEIAFLKTVENV